MACFGRALLSVVHSCTGCWFPHGVVEPASHDVANQVRHCPKGTNDRENAQKGIPSNERTAVRLGASQSKN